MQGYTSFAGCKFGVRSAILWYIIYCTLLYLYFVFSISQNVELSRDSWGAWHVISTLIILCFEIDFDVDIASFFSYTARL